MIVDPARMGLDYRCPAYPLPGDVPIVMRAEVGGATTLLDQEEAKRIVFHWELSEGKIVSGQGTGTVSIDTSELSGSAIHDVEVKLTLEHEPPDMEREKACTIRIDRSCPSPVLFDAFAAITDREERRQLDRLAAYYQSVDGTAVIYVVSYAGAGSCSCGAGSRADQIKNYLIEKRKLAASQIVTVDGGVREQWSVDLFVQLNGTCGPQPTQTRAGHSSETERRCSETQSKCAAL